MIARPNIHRKRIGTTNVLERQSKEIQRRTRAATLFPNEGSLLRLVNAIPIEINDGWIGGKTQWNFEV